MILRFAFIAGLLLVSAILLVTAFQFGDTRPFNLLVNLGTEVFGILVTLAVVDWMLERRRLQERARELAWSTLHAVERAVWVWQGGPRRVDMDELLGLIAGVGPSDEMQPFTRSLLATLGAQTREALSREAAAIKTLPGLATALEELTSLNTLSEGRSSASIPMVSEILAAGTRALAGALGQSTQPIPAGLVRYRDASLESQTGRFHHLRPEAGEASG